MSDLKDRLRGDLIQAMRDRDKLRASTIRMVLTAVTNEEVAGREARELSDHEVVAVLAKEAKKRREAATAFAAAGRDELATKEQSEEQVIGDYLPTQLSAEEITDLVSATIAELGASGGGTSAMGSVMRVVSPQTLGRADGTAVAAEVRRQLG